MFAQTQTETITAARKAHECSWCGERIGAGETYKRYRWFQYGDAGTCRMHLECFEAMGQVADDEGGWIEFAPWDNERPLVTANTRNQPAEPR